MTPTNYLYLFEDGGIAANTDEPTQEDCDSVDAGILNVIRCTNGVFEWLQPDNTWTTIPSKPQ